jgi:hypothetical protein
MGQSSTNSVYGCSVNFATSLEKAHVVASSSAFTNNIQDSGAYKPKFLELFLDII